MSQPYHPCPRLATFHILHIILFHSTSYHDGRAGSQSSTNILTLTGHIPHLYQTIATLTNPLHNSGSLPQLSLEVLPHHNCTQQDPVLIASYLYYPIALLPHSRINIYPYKLIYSRLSAPIAHLPLHHSSPALSDENPLSTRLPPYGQPLLHTKMHTKKPAIVLDDRPTRASSARQVLIGYRTRSATVRERRTLLAKPFVPYSPRPHPVSGRSSPHRPPSPRPAAP